MATFKKSPLLRPRPEIGGLFDIPAGRYHTGKYGDSILNGGFSNFIGLGGRGNTFKTALSLGMVLSILNRYPGSSLTIYDAEITFEWSRIEDMCVRYPNIEFEHDIEAGRITLTSGGEHSGNEWWAIVRERSKNREKATKSELVETPFLTHDSEAIKVRPIDIHFCDSMSQLETDAVAEIYDKHSIDSANANTDALRGAAIKTRLVMQVGGVTTRGHMALITTAHVGDEMKLDQYAPSKQQLAGLKGGLKFKNVPEKFTFLTSNTWLVRKAEPFINKSTKAAEYPLEGYNDAAGDTDLQRLDLLNLRNKSGQAGHVIPVVISQTEGLLPHLTCFNYLKERKDKFGLAGPEGVQKSYRMIFYPEVLLSRTKVRTLIEVDQDPKLLRALELTAQIAQIYEYWPDTPQRYRIDPSELYAKLIQLGYDWNILLETRGYWTYDHYNHPIPPLTAWDLFKMYNEEYIPFWYPEKDKLQVTLKTSPEEVETNESSTDK